MRTATIQDLKVDAILHNQHGSWRVLRKYDDGIWEIRGQGGEKALFECEIDGYTVKES